MKASFDAFHLSADAGRAGQRFCVFHPAQGVPRGAVVHVPALFEEMNKSRRMVALQARTLAAAGFAVLRIDLHGCGDSSGELAWSPCPAGRERGIPPLPRTAASVRAAYRPGSVTTTNVANPVP